VLLFGSRNDWLSIAGQLCHNDGRHPSRLTMVSVCVQFVASICAQFPNDSVRNLLLVHRSAITTSFYKPPFIKSIKNLKSKILHCRLNQSLETDLTYV